MKSIVKKAVAAFVAGSALVGVAAAPADARGWHGHGGWGGGHGGWGGYHHYYRGGGWGPGAALGLGIAGLAVGAAIADDRYDRGYYYAPPPPPPPPAYYGYGYYPRGYYYGY